jgi:hypothetical protein
MNAQVNSISLSFGGTEVWPIEEAREGQPEDNGCAER